MERIWQRWKDGLLALMPRHLRAANVVSTSSDTRIDPQQIPRLYSQFQLALPTALTMAFDHQPLPAEDPRFVARTEAFKQIQTAITKWQNHLPSLTAVVAAHGSGLSSFLNQLRLTLPTQIIPIHFSLAVRPTTVESTLSIITKVFSLAEVPRTVAQAVTVINALPSTAIIIDDAHMLVSRQMGAQAGVQAFGAVLVATQQRHCWILGCAEQAWRRLSYLYEMDRFFDQVIRLDYLDVNALNEAIERRLSCSGYQWAMRAGVVNDEDPFKVHAKKLHDLSFGHLPLAFFILLHAIKVEGTQLHLDLFNTIDSSALKDCDLEEQFSLAEIYVHGSLSEAEHQMMFGLSAEQNLLRLERLCRMGLLNLVRTAETESSNLYRLTPLLSHATVAHLVNSNRLY